MQHVKSSHYYGAIKQCYLQWMDTLFNCDNEGEPYIEEPGASLLDSSIFSTVTDINDSDASNGVAARGMYDEIFAHVHVP